MIRQFPMRKLPVLPVMISILIVSIDPSFFPHNCFALQPADDFSDVFQ